MPTHSALTAKIELDFETSIIKYFLAILEDTFIESITRAVKRSGTPAVVLTKVKTKSHHQH